MSQFNYNPNPQTTARGSMAHRDAMRMTPTAENPLPHLSEEQKAAMVAERKRKEKEEEERKERARLEAIEAEKQRQRDSKAAWDAAEQARLMARAKSIAPDYRREYDAEEPQTFNDAKKVADETYMQFWYDKANAITDKWTDKDYKLLLEKKYHREKTTQNRYKTVRTFPEGYEEYKEIKKHIDYGVLDFTSEKDHRKLIKPAGPKGYGKRQSWIDKSNPLRQAVEAQSAVMEEWLDEAGIDIVIPYKDLKGFDRPDPMRGKGIYLNTGTGAHIDWNSGLKRMQHYEDVGGGFGEYSTAFIRPDPDYGTFGKVLSVIGTITGNPAMRAVGTGLQGGDWKDIAKSHLAGEITAPILEDTFASLGVDAELLGIDPDTFSDSLMDVQTTMIEGGSAKDALIKEFTEPVIDKVVDVAQEALPDVDLGIDIDFDTPDIIEDIGNVVVAIAEPILKTTEDVVKPVIDVAQAVTEPVVDVAQEGIDVLQQAGREVDDVVLQPIKEGVQAVTEPVVDVVDAFIDAVDSPLGDLLGAGGDLIGGMLVGQGQQRTASTPTEDLFDKELFKFDTEIKSTQEMLSPMMNLRRYG